jgi:UDP-N-acetyl-D-mannosaminuronic acid transferase (WecB/TagA/CpsF family)
LAASGSRGAKANKCSYDRVNGRELVNEACKLYDQLNDRIMAEGNKKYVCMNFKERLRRLAVRAHKRYMRRHGRFRAD